MRRLAILGLAPVLVCALSAAVGCAKKRAIGEKCSSALDCASKLCSHGIELGRAVCTATCSADPADCPSGWTCGGLAQPATSPEDPVPTRICVPERATAPPRSRTEEAIANPAEPIDLDALREGPAGKYLPDAGR